VQRSAGEGCFSFLSASAEIARSQVRRGEIALLGRSVTRPLQVLCRYHRAARLPVAIIYNPVRSSRLRLAGAGLGGSARHCAEEAAVSRGGGQVITKLSYTSLKMHSRVLEGVGPGKCFTAPHVPPMVKTYRQAWNRSRRRRGCAGQLCGVFAGVNPRSSLLKLQAGLSSSPAKEQICKRLRFGVSAGRQALPAAAVRMLEQGKCSWPAGVHALQAVSRQKQLPAETAGQQHTSICLGGFAGLA